MILIILTFFCFLLSYFFVTSPYVCLHILRLKFHNKVELGVRGWGRGGGVGRERVRRE